MMMIVLFCKKEDNKMKRLKCQQKGNKIQTLCCCLLWIKQTKELIQQQFKQDLNLYVHTLYDNITNAVTLSAGLRCPGGQVKLLTSITTYYAIDRQQ